jgi:hypothetical protein
MPPFKDGSYLLVNRLSTNIAPPSLPGRLCEFDVVLVSRQKLIRWMAQRQLSGVYSQGQPRPGAEVRPSLNAVVGTAAVLRDLP